MLLASRLQRVERLLLRPGRRKGNGADIEQQGRPCSIVHAALADRHRADRVAMIAMFKNEDAMARRGQTVQRAIVPVAERHLQRDFDRSRSAVGIEDMGERVAPFRTGGELDQATRNLFSGLMRVTGEDELVELPGLLRDGRSNAGMAMAVGRNPPAGDGVDQRAAVCQVQQGPFRTNDMRDGFVKAVLGKGVPYRGGHGETLRLAPASGQASSPKISLCRFIWQGRLAPPG